MSPSVRTEYRARIDFRRVGKFARPAVREALAQANAENAALAERMVKMRASRLVKHERDPRFNRQTSRRSMVDLYRARVTGGGKSFTVTNQADRAIWFEFGTRRHVIRPRRAGGRLAWKPTRGPWQFRSQVNHPGQKGTFVVAHTMNELSGAFERNIDRAIKRAFS